MPYASGGNVVSTNHSASRGSLRRPKYTEWVSSRPESRWLGKILPTLRRRGRPGEREKSPLRLGADPRVPSPPRGRVRNAMRVSFESRSFFRLSGHLPVLGCECVSIFGGLLKRLAKRITVLKGPRAAGVHHLLQRCLYLFSICCASGHPVVFSQQVGDG